MRAVARIKARMKPGASFALRNRTLTTVSMLALVTSAFAPHAYGADAGQTSPTEEIVVTGSRILREGYEAPTPLAVVTTEALQSSGTGNLSDFINTMPAFAGSTTPVSGSQSISAGTAGVNLLNLRALGPARTLVLLDGQRSVASVLATSSVDINTFPQQLISRVDVVTGGASAVYGSDAVSGVVNFVLDKTFTGVKAEASGGVTTYGDDRSWKIALAGGFPFANGRGHVLLSGDMMHEDGVIPGSGGKGKRAWNAEGWQIVTTPGYSATTGAGGLPEYNVMNHVGIWTATPGGVITTGPLKGTAFGPGGSQYQIHFGTITDARYTNSPDWYALDIREDHGNNLSPRQGEQNVFLRAAYDVTDNINVFLQWSWSHANTYDYTSGQFQVAAVTIRGDNAFLQNVLTPAQRALITPASTMTLGSFNYDLPPLAADNDRILARYVGGASGKFDAFGTGWSWSGYYQKGVSRNSQGVPGVFTRSALTKASDAVLSASGQIVCRVNADAITTNDDPACQPYNYFGIGVNTQPAINYVTGLSLLNQTIGQDVFASSVTGEPLSLWAGPVSLAVSLEHRKESVKGKSDAGSLVSDHLSGNSRPTIGSYSVTEGALETLVPLAKDTSWAENLDLSAAVRFTGYSTAGYVTTWKVGSTYAPISDIKFRFTRSRDIRAPNLADLFAGGTASSGAQVDPFPNAINARPTVLGLAVGNPALGPEKGDTTGIGVVLQPTFVPGFSFSADYWNINMSGRIASVAAAQELTICYDFLINHIDRPGAQSFCNNIIRTNNGLSPTAGGTQVALTAPGNLYQISTSPTNFVGSTTRGIDFEASYRFGLDDLMDSLAGTFSIHGLATRYLKNYTNDGFNPPTDDVGQNSGANPPKWRYTVTAQYDNDPWRASLTARGLSAGTYNNSYIECKTGCPLSTPDHRTIDNNHIAGALYGDASVTYKLSIGDAGQAEAFLNVRNLLNSDPAVAARAVTGNNFFEPLTNLSDYDVLGRVFRAGVRFKM